MECSGGEPLVVPAGPSGWVWSAAFSPDASGFCVAPAAAGGVIRRGRTRRHTPSVTCGRQDHARPGCIPAESHTRYRLSLATHARDAMLRARVQADLATSLPSSTRPEPTPAERRAAFLALPEPIGQPAYEMQPDGSIIQKMAPKPRHSAVQEELLFRFRTARARRIAP